MDVGSVLCSAVIWAARDDEAKEFLPPNLKTRISNYEEAHGEFVVERVKLRLLTSGKKQFRS